MRTYGKVVYQQKEMVMNQSRSKKTKRTISPEALTWILSEKHSNGRTWQMWMRELEADMREGYTWNRLNEMAHRNEQLVA